MAKNEKAEAETTTETEDSEIYTYRVKSGRHTRFSGGKRVVYSPKAGDENVMELTEAQAETFGKSIERIATPTTQKSRTKTADDDTDNVVNGIPDTAEKFIELIEGEEDETKLATYEKYERERSAGPRKTVLAAIADQKKLLKG